MKSLSDMNTASSLLEDKREVKQGLRNLLGSVHRFVIILRYPCLNRIEKV